MEDKDKFTHVNISDILSKFRCKSCNINYPDKIEYIIGITFICKSCIKSSNRDSIIEKILN